MSATAQLTMDDVLNSDILSDGTGFRLIPRKPRAEISCRDVMRILGLESPQSVVNIINSPQGSRLIRWRWKNAVGGHRLFDLESVQRYKATQYETAAA